MPEAKAELGETGAEREEAARLSAEATQPVFGRCRRRLNACSISLFSDCGSIRQKEPLPGSD